MSSRWFQPRVKTCGPANRLRSSSRKHSQESIGAVRHPYLHFDVARKVRPTSLRASDTVPTPTAFLSTSLGKYQILCRVDSFTFEQESTLKLLGIPFGGDLAYTDCDRVPRTPGFRNCRYDQPCSFTVAYPCDSTSNSTDFRLDIPAANAMLLPQAIPSAKHSDKHTNSEHDWAWILHKLAHGEDAPKLTRTLASRRSDKTRPLSITPNGRPISHRLDFAASKAFRWGTLSHCFWSAASSRLPLRCVSVNAQARARRRRCKAAYIWGGVHRFCKGAEGMILHSISWQCRNGASHRKNFDTPPLRGCCKALRGAPERPVQNEQPAVPRALQSDPGVLLEKR